MTSTIQPSAVEPRKVSPEELTEGFRQLGLREGDRIIMHAFLDNIGAVDGGAAMVLHRLLGVLGKTGTLLMPTFTSITRHTSSHENNTKPGCWCEGHEDRHLPFIPELQPDRNIGVIAQRLCSWPSSRRSGHPAYSFVAVGFDSVTAIHVAEQVRLSTKFVRERALTFTSKGRTWVDITSLGCSNGFEKLKAHLGSKDFKETKIGAANSQAYSMKTLIDRAESLIEKQPNALLCENPACLSCSLISK